MEYISTKEASLKWDLSEQVVRRFCREGRIIGAIQDGTSWLIPEKARKPRRKDLGDADANNLPPLAKTLYIQKKKNNYHGFYDYVKVNLTYSSCRMASNRLTRNNIEMIFKKGKVAPTFEPVKVSDLIEALNHGVCVDFILDHILEPISPAFIRKIHKLLMSGTVDERLRKVEAGVFRTASYKNQNRQLPPASLVNSTLESAIKEYEGLNHPDDVDLLAFHVAFEQIAPFEDGNGRVGRLILFKECLRHEIMPFIIDDKKRSMYLEGIQNWDKDKSILYEVMSDTQKRFEAQIRLQELKRHGESFLPEGYREEDLRDEF